MSRFTSGERRGTILLLIIIALIIVVMALHGNIFHSCSGSAISETDISTPPAIVVDSNKAYTDTTTNNRTHPKRKTIKNQSRKDNRPNGPRSRDYLSEPV